MVIEMNKKVIILTILALLLSGGVLFIGQKSIASPMKVYRVYLDGKELGNVRSKEKLEEYIDKSQEELKEKYNVEQVFSPKNISIKEDRSFFAKLDEVEDIYKKIEESSAFTIEGYEIKIKGVDLEFEGGITTTESKTIYSLSEDIFEEAFLNTVYAFVEEEEYQTYIENTQQAIEDEGSRIEDVKTLNNITVNKTKISTSEKIFTEEEELSQYLLFSSLDEAEDYYVKEGDNIENIAFDNKLSVQEFLIANPEITSADNLLYPGQKVSVAFIEPAFTVEKEEYVVKNQVKNYETIIENDSTLAEGVERVKQNGANGLSKITSKYIYQNRELVDVEIINEEQLMAPISRIITRGTRYIPNVGTIGNWAWPTAYRTISSHYGWRGGKLHKGIDITGQRGSAIFAINNGTVVKAGWEAKGGGNVVHINHNNGFHSEYAHLDSVSVQVGQTVSRGERIGAMGSTGYSFGNHLHFGVWRSQVHGSSPINPMSLYQ